MRLSEQLLTLCRKENVPGGPEAYLARWKKAVLAGEVRGSDAVLTELGIDVKNPEMTQAELTVLAREGVSPEYLSSRKRRGLEVLL